MSMHGIRRLTVLAAVAALTLPLGITSAGAAAPQPAEARTTTTADPFPGAYISPWGDAQVALSDESLAWLEQSGITLEAISPFAMDADGRGFSMPIGSTAGDGLDSKGRIYYPGGLKLKHANTGQTLTLKATYIRLMPTPGYSAGVQVNGKSVSDEVMVADTTRTEALTSARPSFTGFRLEKVPFRVTAEFSNLFADVTGTPGPRAGSLFGTLTPNFDYIPTKSSQVGLPKLP
ncbi:hypothetical protein [Streptomyces sp. NPDC055749]